MSSSSRTTDAGVHKLQVAQPGKKRNVGAPDEPSWVAHCGEESPEWKQALARYATTHLIRYGYVIQVGSGTTFNCLMDEILAFQRSKNTPLDLVVLTTNLQILARGRDAQQDDPKIFNAMQIILTGGGLNLSLDSLVGEYAAKGICNEDVHPRIVFLGAAGLSFQGEDLTITYQFQDEISTQVAYATRPTEHRVILCDHTKLGRRSAWKAPITTRSLLRDTNKCTIISTYPDDPDEQKRVQQVLEPFDSMLKELARDRDYDDRNLIFRFVNKDAEVVPDLERSLSKVRTTLDNEA